MTAEELKRVEDIVNEKINEAIEVHTDIMTVDEAKRQVPWLSSARNTVKRYVSYQWAIFLRSSAVVHM